MNQSLGGQHEQGDTSGLLIPQHTQDVLNAADRLLAANGDNLPVRFQGMNQLALRSLTGELLMYFTGVELSDHPSTPQRAKGIVEALSRIATQPEIFEALTDAPFTHEMASRLLPTGTIEQITEVKALKPQRSEIEIAEAEAVKAKIQANGYLSHAMVPNDKLVRLHYVSDGSRKKWVFGRQDNTNGLTLKLVAKQDDTIGWDVYSSPYRDIVKRNIRLAKVFNLVAVEPGTDEYLHAHLNSPIHIGDVSQGSLLDFEGNYRLTQDYDQITTRAAVVSDNYRMPMVLQQAYYGHTEDFPLF